MKALQIKRYNDIIFYSEHKNILNLQDMFKVCKLNNIISGGDRVIYTNNKNIIKEFYICIICNKNQANRTGLRCKSCNNKHIKKTQTHLSTIDQRSRNINKANNIKNQADTQTQTQTNLKHNLLTPNKHSGWDYLFWH